MGSGPDIDKKTKGTREGCERFSLIFASSVSPAFNEPFTMGCCARNTLDRLLRLTYSRDSLLRLK